MSELYDGGSGVEHTDCAAGKKMKTKRRSLTWQYRKSCRRLRQMVYGQLYRDADRDITKSILIAGTGRSGTTWLADIIASQLPCRVMFEPFHSRMVSEFQRFHYFQYMRPAEQNRELWSFSRKVLSGNIRQPWIDRQVDCLRPKLRVIKEIRANLFLAWLHAVFPDVPILFMIRHPCAVVLSRMQLGWATDSDIVPFLSQPTLIDDFLSDHLDTIKRARTEEEKHAIIWCISNVVPLKQFDHTRLKVVFYENLCTQPEVELNRIFKEIRQEFSRSVFHYLTVPSMTSSSMSPVVNGTNKIEHWKEKLSEHQISNILAIVEKFGLDHLYDDTSNPIRRNLETDGVNLND